MERALGGACLLPPEHIFRSIVKKFREHSRRSSGGEVNYRAFLAAVSQARQIHIAGWARGCGHASHTLLPVQRVESANS